MEGARDRLARLFFGAYLSIAGLDLVARCGVRGVVGPRVRARLRPAGGLLPGRLGLPRLAPRDQDEPLELGHEDAVLVEDAGVDLDRAAVGLGARLALLEDLGLDEQGVAVEDG